MCFAIKKRRTPTTDNYYHYHERTVHLTNHIKNKPVAGGGGDGDKRTELPKLV